ncbi:hypothetical protein ACFL54_07850 [Planctomycetota bacterium]
MLRTNFVGTDMDPDRVYQALGRKVCHFEGRRWNLIAASWGFQTNIFQLSINGLALEPTYRKLGRYSGMGTLAMPYRIIRKIDLITWQDITSSERPFRAPIRLGAFARTQGFGVNLHEPADSTYGEFVIYKDAISSEASFQRIGDFFRDEGFYYHDPGEPAVYTTPLINLAAKAGKLVTIRSISWTGHWPQYVIANEAANTEHLDPVWEHMKVEQRPQWMTADFGDPGKWAPFLVDIKTDDTWHYGSSATKMTNSGGSIPLDADGKKLKTEESINLKFYFNLAPNHAEPLRESPYLDDITITYIPAHGVKFLNYQMH